MHYYRPNNSNIIRISEDSECNETTIRKRERYWSNDGSFMLALISLVNNLGTIFQFPYLWRKHGHSIFLIPLTVMLVVIGIPVFTSEVIIGKIYGGSIITKFNSFSASGIGYTMVIICTIISSYQNITLVYAIKSMIETLKSILIINSTTGFLNNTFQEEVNDALFITPNNFSYTITLLVLVNILIFIITYKDARSIEQTLYITAFPPTFALAASLLNAMLNPKRLNIMLFVFSPDFKALKCLDAWVDAAIYILRMVGCGIGTIVTYSYYNRPDDVKKTINVGALCIFIPVLGLFLSIVSAHVILSGIIYLSSDNGLPVQQLLDKNTMIMMFVNYIKFNDSKIFSLVLFMSVFSIGLNSSISKFQTIHAILEELFGQSTKYNILLRILTNIALLVLSLFSFTESGQVVSFAFDKYIICALTYIVILVEISVILYDMPAIKCKLESLYRVTINRFVAFYAKIHLGLVLITCAALFFACTALIEDYEINENGGQIGKVQGWITILIFFLTILPMCIHSLVICLRRCYLRSRRRSYSLQQSTV